MENTIKNETVEFENLESNDAMIQMDVTDKAGILRTVIIGGAAVGAGTAMLFNGVIIPVGKKVGSGIKKGFGAMKAGFDKNKAEKEKAEKDAEKEEKPAEKETKETKKK